MARFSAAVTWHSPSAFTWLWGVLHASEEVDHPKRTQDTLQGRGEHCLACGWCAASFVLSITFIRLALLTGNPLTAFYLGNLLFITLRISIHIFTRLRPCEKLDPHHPTSVLPLWKVFHCWAVRNHYKPEEQIPSYECLQLASRTRDDVWAVIGSLLPLMLRNTAPLWKEDAYCLNTSALKDQRVIKPWASHCEALHGAQSTPSEGQPVLPAKSTHIYWYNQCSQLGRNRLVRCCSSKCPGLMMASCLQSDPEGWGRAHLAAAALWLLRLWGVVWWCQLAVPAHTHPTATAAHQHAPRALLQAFCLK